MDLIKKSNESYELGVNSFVVKPIDFNDFAKAVSQLPVY